MSLEFKWEPIGNYVDTISGFAFKSKDFIEEGIPVIKIKNIVPPDVVLEDVQYVSDLFLIEKSNYVLSKGDILITLTGSNVNQMASAVGQVAKISFDKPCLLNQRVAKLIPKDTSKCNIDYFYYILSTEEMHYNLASRASGSANQANINPTIIKSMETLVPPLETQNKIVKILKTIDEKININKEINKNLLSIADAIFKKEFRKFEEYLEEDLISSDFGLIPKNWHYKTLDEISDVAIGKTPPRKETWWFSEKEGVKWVSIKDLGNSGTYIFETSEYLTEEAIDKFNVKLIPEDTVILSFKLTVGRLGITTEEMTTNEAIAHFKLDSESPISKEYLYLYLKNFNYEELGSTSSIAKAINSKIVKKIPILVPESNKLNEFKELFENIFNEIKSNQLEINNLTKLRDTLLPKLMSGEIDVSKINCDIILRLINLYFLII